MLNRTEVLAEGFPTDPAGNPDHIYAIFSVVKDLSFDFLLWNSDNLKKALVRFLNRQRPSYKAQLTTLTRDFAKPFLVSLADLQETIAGPD